LKFCIISDEKGTEEDASRLYNFIPKGIPRETFHTFLHHDFHEGVLSISHRY